MKRAFLVGLVLCAGLTSLTTPAAAQTRLIGFAGYGLGGEYRTGIQSEQYQQVSAAYEFIRAGEEQKALALLTPLQAQSFAPALTLLGNLYASGRGVAQDNVRAAQLYAQAAERGDPRAMYLHGYALDNGIGTARDRKAARFWMQRASDSGIIELQKAVRHYRKHGTD